ncbi:hypothetical protein [Sphingomonas sp. Leaf412]|uniref:hypothetical protein n=1 Tax=Sphingomonas sp. Leaf412 TaxID=1736370 RepID=UPI000A9CE964|nr:hypothetical protein [Sphingomonas sp. Leaf412]
MLKVLMTIAVVAVTPLPAAAQDGGGAIDLGQLARTQTQASMMQGHAERDGARQAVRGPNGVALGSRARAYCEDYPNVRNRLGARDPRAMRLAAACRQAGYRY